MKIAYLIPALSNKGPVLVVKELTSALLKKGVKCDVYYYDDIVEVGFDCQTFKISYFEDINFDEYDIVHTHMLRPDAYGYLKSFKKKNRKKLITTIHNYVKEELSYSYNIGKATIGVILWKLFWSRYLNIIVLSNDAKKYYSRYIPASILNVVHNGRNVNTALKIDDQDKVLFSTLRKNNSIILGTIAAFNARKGLEQIVKVLPFNERLAFVIVGDGPQKEELLDLAISLGVEKRCYFLGSRDNGFRYNAAFDIYVMPSRSEGVPLALIEAASYKKPIVCSNIDVLVEMFDPDEVCFFSLDNIQSLDFAIREASSEKGIEYSGKAYLKYTKMYTSEIMANKYLDIYTKML